MRAADILTPLFLTLLIAPAAVRIGPDFSTQPREVFMDGSSQRPDRSARLSELRPGDVVMLDAGFPCRAAGPARVFLDPDIGLYVSCRTGRHFLDGQEDEAGRLVGVSHPPADFDPADYVGGVR